MQLPCGTFSTTYEFDKAIIKTRAHWIVLALAITLAFAFPTFSHPYLIHVVNFVFISIIAALGLNILSGCAGQISIGHSAFMAVGGYTSAVITYTLGASFWLALPCAIVAAGLVGLIFGLPSLRLKGFYLLLSTLAAQFIIVYIVAHLDITGGLAGIDVPYAQLGNIVFNTDKSFYYIILVVLILATFCARNLVRSKVGRAFIAVRDNDLVAEVMGVSLFRYKLLAFFIGCCYAGAAGSLWAHWHGYVCPEQFSLMMSVWLLGYIIIGGMGTTVGPFLGTILVLGLTEGLSTLVTGLGTTYPHLLDIIAPLKDLIFGIMLALFLILEPRGLAHRWYMMKSWYSLFPFSY
ncbi:MAG: branched-chain amino acid ABC transporter permease [Dehalococcoidia bacterium]|nr:branched-chain amino acid ABC transporter permease [Dehalococcoidia bacterium]